MINKTKVTKTQTQLKTTTDKPFSWSNLVMTLAGVSCLLLNTNSASAEGFQRKANNPSETFYQQIDEFQQFANQESKAIKTEEIGARVLDTDKLKLTIDHNVKIFFINEGANYRNQLGVKTTGKNQTEKIIFEDITCIDKKCKYPGYRDKNLQFGTTDKLPLEIGDYYELGKVAAGSVLDFFLRRDGYQRTKTETWQIDTDKNVDKTQHVIAYDYKDYLVLAWEDLFGGGDKDYNDVIFAIDIGKKNINNIPSEGVPEPLTILGTMLAGVFGYWFKNQVPKTEKKHLTAND